VVLEPTDALRRPISGSRRVRHLVVVVVASAHLLFAGCVVIERERTPGTPTGR